MENLIIKKRKEIQNNILKAFSGDIEKGHNVGDISPDGKYVWTEYAPGKFDWHVKKQSSSTDEKDVPKGLVSDYISVDDVVSDDNITAEKIFKKMFPKITNFSKKNLEEKGYNFSELSELVKDIKFGLKRIKEIKDTYLSEKAFNSMVSVTYTNKNELYKEYDDIIKKNINKPIDYLLTQADKYSSNKYYNLIKEAEDKKEPKDKIKKLELEHDMWLINKEAFTNLYYFKKNSLNRLDINLDKYRLKKPTEKTVKVKVDKSDWGYSSLSDKLNIQSPTGNTISIHRRKLNSSPDEIKLIRYLTNAGKEKEITISEMKTLLKMSKM